MTKLEELFAQKNEIKTKMQEAINNKKVDDAKAYKSELEEICELIEAQELLDKQTLEPENATPLPRETAKSANFIRAAIKKFIGETVTEAEASLLVPSSENTKGTNGEAYIIPQDIRTTIIELVRDYGSLRGVVGVEPVSSITGSFTVESFDSITGLADLEDGQTGEDINEGAFVPVEFRLRKKAAFTKLSNTLLKLTDNNLVSYIAKRFARKAVVSENTAIVTALKKGKTVKKLNNFTELQTSLIEDIDPAALSFATVLTNQSGFAYLKSLKNQNGESLLKPHPTDKDKGIIDGIVVTRRSNGVLPNEGDKAPIFYGDLFDAVKLLELENMTFATDSSAGFYSDTTVARIIEWIDAVQFDASDKCYIYGTLPTLASAASLG